MDRKQHQSGFTLIATLLLLLLLSGIAIGMLMRVRTEGSVGTQDLENNMTFHAAEGAIEKMTSDLANTFQNIEAPTVSNIEALSALVPATNQATGINYPVYSLTPATTATGALASSYGEVATGPNQGLYAQLIPITLQATAQGPLGDEVNMSRTVEIALIPVFQFGVFSDSDLGFFSSPNLNFAGRVHTNGDLYLGVATCCTLTFHDKLTSYGNVVRAVLPNGLAAASYNDNGSVLIPYASNGCDGTQPACTAMSTGGDRQGSLVGAGGNPAASAYNTSWKNTSLTVYNSFILDGNYGKPSSPSGNPEGATNLSLPFVNGTNGTNASPQPYEIVRRPPAGESVTSALGSSRLYNEATIRVLLSDDPGELPCGDPSAAPPCGGSGDAQNVRLANVKDSANGVDLTHGVATSTPALAVLPAGDSYTTYFATASTAVPNPSTWTKLTPTLPSDWPYSPLSPFPAGTQTIYDGGNVGGPFGSNIAPYLVPDPSGNGISAAPAVAMQLCNPSTPVSVPPAAGPPDCKTGITYPYYQWPTGTGATVYPNTANQGASTWNLIDGYLRVEYRDSNGNYHPVTQEWLGLGFARDVVPPTAGAGSNPINPNAILLFQEKADRDGTGTFSTTGAAPNYTSACTKTSGGKCVQTTYTPYPGKPPEVALDPTTNYAWWGDSNQPATNQSPTQYNYYPITFYDAREGEPRDTQVGNDSCTPNGAMSIVEIDVANLKQWLNGGSGTKGKNVDYVSQNGYVLYFSDRRGMLPNPNGTQVSGTVNTKTGDSGLEDSINSSVASGTPDGKLDPIPAGKNFSPEDVNLNGVLDNWGSANLGLGLGYIGAPYVRANQVNQAVTNGTDDPYVVGNRMPACSLIQKNWISGARHGLKLVDGTLGSLPLRPDNGKGGFTVGSENPVYIFGDYNSNSGDKAWGGGADSPLMAAASVIADSVTMLSNSWFDQNSYLQNVTRPDLYRLGSNTYYRLAIAGGKNVNFPFPSWENSTDYGFGTDGGVHNFLRFLEDWQDPGATLNYMGSLVSLYYSTYNTGTFKCCTYSVYQPPTRNYIFDPDFTQPQNLPPATPMFRDVDNLSYRQNFTPCTVQSNGICQN